MIAQRRRIAVLFRGPFLLREESHVRIFRENIEILSQSLGKLDLHLASYANQIPVSVRELFPWSTLLEVPSLEDEEIRAMLKLSNPWPPWDSGHSRYNTFRQHFMMKKAIEAINQLASQPDFIFYMRTDVLFKCSVADLESWLTPHAYSTVHIANAPGCGWTNDMIGCSSLGLFSAAWNYSSLEYLSDLISSLHIAENVLDSIISQKGVKLSCAPMKFNGAHLLRPLATVEEELCHIDKFFNEP